MCYFVLLPLLEISKPCAAEELNKSISRGSVFEHEENGIVFAGFRSIYKDEFKSEDQQWKAEGQKEVQDAASAFSFIEDLGFEWNPTTICNLNFFDACGSNDKLVLSDKIKLEFQTAQKGAVKYQSQGLLMLANLAKIKQEDVGIDILKKN